MDREEAQSLVKENLKNMPQAVEKAVEGSRDYLGREGMTFIEQGLEDVMATTRSAVEVSESKIRQNPFLSLVGAVAIGLTLGWILRGPRHD